MLRTLKLVVSLSHNEYGHLSQNEIFDAFELFYEYDYKKQYVIIVDENWNNNIYEIVL